MRSLAVLPRLLRVASVLLAWRLDEVVETAHLFRPLKLVRPLLGRPRPDVATLPRGARLRGALTELGPIFVKAGQVLSTRRDLVPADIADELALLQDQVPPFPGDQARAIVERELRRPVGVLFARFDERALASASIAQVHAATLHDGREVVVKVLRPGIERRIARDVALLPLLAAAPDIARLAAEAKVDPARAAALYGAVGERLGLARLRLLAGKLNLPEHWDRLAVRRLLDDLAGAQRTLTARLLASGETDMQALESWSRDHGETLARMREFLEAIESAGELSVAKLLLAASQVQTLT